MAGVAASGSTLDIESIVSGLMSTEQKPLQLVTAQKTAYQTKISAYGALNSALSTFQTALASMASESKFNVQTAKPADNTVYTATANGKASNGNYAITVNQLAQPQKVALAGFTNTTDVVGTGTVSISFGSYDSTGNTFTANSSKASTTITINSSNNTLAGVRDAINGANAGVTASIVNDGSSNRLVITSKDTGEVNSMKITVSDSDGGSTDAAGLSRLAFDPTASAGNGKNLTVMQAAKNALLTIDGVDIIKPSNTISDAVDGITFTLLKPNVGVPVNLTVSLDTDTIQKNMAAFVKAYNDLDTTVRALTKYDATSKTAAPLLGDAATRTISTQIKQILTGAMDSSNTFTTLSQIGVSFQRDGKLALDNTKLTTALNTDAAAVSRMFAATAKATDGQVGFVSSTAKTVAGNYAVNISQLATQGSLTGSGAPNLTITQGVNDHLDLSFDGAAYSVDLVPGTYASAQALVDSIKEKIAGTGFKANVVLEGGAIKISSQSYGSNSAILLNGGNGAADLFGSTPASVTGVDVAGTINGVTAIGSGQQLTGAVGDKSDGLVLSINGGALGDRGTVKFTTGYAYQLNSLAKGFLDTDGLLDAKTDGLNDSVAKLTKQQEVLNDRLDALEKRYRAQYTALDALLAKMQATSTSLTQQLASLSTTSSS